MSEVNIGVVRVGDEWTIVGSALRTRMFSTRLQAVSAAHRMADNVIGHYVRLHIQNDGFELQPPRAMEG